MPDGTERRHGDRDGDGLGDACDTDPRLDERNDVLDDGE